MRRYLTSLRQGQPVCQPRSSVSPRSVAGLLLRHPEHLSPSEGDLLDRLCVRCPGAGSRMPIGADVRGVGVRTPGWRHPAALAGRGEQMWDPAARLIRSRTAQGPGGLHGWRHASMKFGRRGRAQHQNQVDQENDVRQGSLRFAEEEGVVGQLTVRRVHGKRDRVSFLTAYREDLTAADTQESRLGASYLTQQKATYRPGPAPGQR